MSSSFRFVLALALAASLAACGQKGDLVLPDRDPAQPAPEQPDDANEGPDTQTAGGDAG
jgi:predicted small lipoprotein YifL